MSVQEIETAVSSLSQEELSQFQRWFEEFIVDAWDGQMEKDAAEGKLDFLFEESAQERQSGLLQDWPKKPS